MGKIAIVTDSNSGITQAQAEELGVYVIPMPFYINEKMYLEGVTLTPVSYTHLFLQAITSQCPYRYRRRS